MEPVLQPKKIVHVDHVLVSILDSCCVVQTLEEYKSLLRDKVRKVLPHAMALGGLVDLWKLSVLDYVNVDFPVNYVNSVIGESGSLKSPLIRCWKKKYQPFYVNDIQVIAAIDAEWVEVASQNGINNLVVHGLVDLSGKLTSYFCFANTPIGWTNKHCRILQLIFPGLHVALKRVLTNESKKRVEAVSLSSREIDIIRLLQNGRTNKQIAITLGISENTVRNHMHNAFEKLNVKNRAQAIAKAASHRLIHL
jgi:transcriptional regulator EpsA